jgi:hypothetical protein
VNNPDTNKRRDSEDDREGRERERGDTSHLPFSVGVFFFLFFFFF